MGVFPISWDDLGFRRNAHTSMFLILFSPEDNYSGRSRAEGSSFSPLIC